MPTRLLGWWKSSLAVTIGAVAGAPSPGSAADPAGLTPLLRIEWRLGPDYPMGIQDSAVGVVDDALYIMGGVNYTVPYTYRDTYRLQHRQGQWEWQELPAARLPWPVYGAAAGTAVIGKKIYLFGVADFFPAPGAKDCDFHSEAGREASPVSRALLVLDPDHLEAGWQRLPDCPGLPQFDAGVAAAAGKLYRLGGIFAPLNPGDGLHYFNAVDSWAFDPAAKAWSRLADLPHGCNRRALTFADRYIVLVAGYKYAQTWYLDGSHTEVYTEPEKARDWKDFFEDTVLVYDTVTSRLGMADPLLEKTSYPSSAVVGGTLYCLGGEGGPRLWHPATLQIGKIVRAVP